MQSGYFSKDRATSVHAGRENGIYQLKFVINPSRQADPDVRAAFIDLARSVAAEALKGHPVILHLCNGNFGTLHRERLIHGPMGLTIFNKHS